MATLGRWFGYGLGASIGRSLLAGDAERHDRGPVRIGSERDFKADEARFRADEARIEAQIEAEKRK